MDQQKLSEKKQFSSNPHAMLSDFASVNTASYSPVLHLSFFSKVPRVSFGTVAIGSSCRRQLLLRNPDDVGHYLTLDKLPNSKGFSVDNHKFFLEAHQEIFMQITWEPTAEGNVRESISFKCDGTRKITAIVFGSCEAPKKEEKGVKKPPANLKKPFAEVQAKLQTTAKNRSSVNRQPLPRSGKSAEQKLKTATLVTAESIWSEMLCEDKYRHWKNPEFKRPFLKATRTRYTLPAASNSKKKHINDKIGSNTKSESCEQTLPSFNITGFERNLLASTPNANRLSSTFTVLEDIKPTQAVKTIVPVIQDDVDKDESLGCYPLNCKDGPAEQMHSLHRCIDAESEEKCSKEIVETVINTAINTVSIENEDKGSTKSKCLNQQQLLKNRRLGKLKEDFENSLNLSRELEDSDMFCDFNEKENENPVIAKTVSRNIAKTGSVTSEGSIPLYSPLEVEDLGVDGKGLSDSRETFTIMKHGTVLANADCVGPTVVSKVPRFSEVYDSQKTTVIAKENVCDPRKTLVTAKEDVCDPSKTLVNAKEDVYDPRKTMIIAKEDVCDPRKTMIICRKDSKTLQLDAGRCKNIVESAARIADSGHLKESIAALTENKSEQAGDDHLTFVLDEAVGNKANTGTWLVSTGEDKLPFRLDIDRICTKAEDKHLSPDCKSGQKENIITKVYENVDGQMRSGDSMPFCNLSLKEKQILKTKEIEKHALLCMPISTHNIDFSSKDKIVRSKDDQPASDTESVTSFSSAASENFYDSFDVQPELDQILSARKADGNIHINDNDDDVLHAGLMPSGQLTVEEHKSSNPTADVHLLNQKMSALTLADSPPTARFFDVTDDFGEAMRRASVYGSLTKTLSSRSRLSSQLSDYWSEPHRRRSLTFTKKAANEVTISREIVLPGVFNESFTKDEGTKNIIVPSFKENSRELESTHNATSFRKPFFVDETYQLKVHKPFDNTKNFNETYSVCPSDHSFFVPFGKSQDKGRPPLSNSSCTQVLDVDKEEIKKQQTESAKRSLDCEAGNTNKRSKLEKGRYTQRCQKEWVAKTEQNSRPRKTLPISRLKLKKCSSDLPRHPLPFVAKNMYFDERWMEKQELGFTRWLNFVLTPPDELQLPDSETKFDASKLFALRKTISDGDLRLAPSKEDVSIRAYTAKRHLNQLRRSAVTLFQSESIVQVIERLEIQVESGRLQIRKDVAMHADLGIKQRFMEMVLSFNPLWLRIGLETVYGEVLPLQNNSDVSRLSRFVLHRLLRNPDIEAAFAHPSVVNFYKPGFEEEMKRFTLKKFLILVFFLDRAKERKLIAHDPCLFSKTANYKSTNDLLMVLSRDYLAGEGNVVKHLGFLGCKLTHKQTALDEFDYAVKHLATDLRDGLRLAQVMKLLCPDFKFTSKLRVPAISRLQKIHNMNVVFSYLKQSGINLEGITSRDIVDGHREKTLALLWRLVFNHQVESLLCCNKLKAEIKFLRENKVVRDAMMCLATKNESSPDKLLGLTRLSHSSSIDTYFRSEKLSLLLGWCQAVSAHYNIQVENFTVAFADGRVLCHLIHHYHSDMLPREKIHLHTTQSRIISAEDSNSEDSLTDSCYSNFRNETGKNLDEHLLEHEKENLKLAFSKINELGGVPMLTRVADMCNTIPDEKVVITLVTFLCVRLLDLRDEIHASRIIQIAWRKYKIRRDVKFMQQQNDAARIIQYHIRKFLYKRRHRRVIHMTVMLQSRLRGKLARKEAQRVRAEKCQHLHENSAIKIQTVVRRYLAVIRYRKMLKATVLIQSAVRGYFLRKKIRKQNSAAARIQSWYIALKQGKAQRDEYLRSKKTAIYIQSWWRSVSQCRRYKLEKHLVIKLQARVKAHQVRVAYCSVRKAAIVIQSRYRARNLCKRQRDEYQRIVRAVVVIQSHWRRRQVLDLLQSQKAAAVTIQSYIRCLTARKQYVKMKQAAACIQGHFRAYVAGKQERSLFLNKRSNAIIIQRWFRASYNRIQEQNNKAAMQIQSFYRLYAVRKKFLILRKAVITVQSHWRGFTDRKHARERLCAVKTLQSHIVAYNLRCKAHREYCLQRNATLTIQATYRMLVERRNFFRRKQAAVVIQSFYRGMIARNERMKRMAAVRTLQIRFRANVEAHCQRELYTHMRASAVLIQKVYRGYVLREEFLVIRSSIIKIQSYVRGWQARTEKRRRLSALIALQKWWKLVFDGRVQRAEYIRLKTATVVLQSVFRGYRQRNCYRTIRSAAVKIQVSYRGYRQRLTFKKTLWAVSVIQQRYKAKVSGRREVHAYNEKRIAVVKLQSHLRCIIQRHKYIKCYKAVICIQSYYRGWHQRRELRRQALAAVCIQVHYRAYIIGKLTRQEYLLMKISAIIIQSAFRRFTVQKSYLYIQSSVVLIQSHIRSFLARKLRDEKMKAVCTIQSYFRAWHTGKLQLQRYLTMKLAAITIQAAYRGFVQRKQYLKLQGAAIIIQAYWRGQQARKCCSVCMNAVLLLQMHMKATLECRRQREKYLNLKAAAVLVQSAYRGYKERKRYRQIREATILLQSHCRGWIDRKKRDRQLWAVTVVQRRYRARQLCIWQRSCFLATRKSIVTVQSVVRQFVLRKKYFNIRAAAVVIQSYFRMWQAVKVRRRKMNAAMVIQAAYRSHLLQKRKRERLQAAVMLQSHIRLFLQQKQYLRQRQAAVKIQSWYKRKVVQRDFATLKHATMIIQQRFRGWLLCKHLRQQYLQDRVAIIRVQACARRWKVKKELQHQHLAALTIQSNYRMYKTVNQYKKVKQSTITLQKHTKAWICGCRTRRDYVKLKRSVVVLQKHYRGLQDRKYVTKVRSARIIQAWIRGCLVRKSLAREASAATVIQANFKTWKLKKAYLQKRQCAVTIQRYYRSHVLANSQRMDFLHLRQSSLIIQKYYRAMQGRKEAHLLRAARKVQAVVRCCVTRRQYTRLRIAAVKIQATYKMMIVRDDYANLRLVVKRLQARVRANRGSKRMRVEYLTYRAAVVTIQAYFRGWQSRRLAQRERAARKIQAFYRMHRTRARFVRFKIAVIQLQSHWRRKTAQNQFIILRTATSCLQAFYRRYLYTKRIQKEFQQTRKSAIVLQARYKCIMQRRHFLTMRCAAIVIQKSYRAYALQREYQQKQRSAIVLQAYWKMQLASTRFRNMRKSVVIIQTAFRKHCLRERQKRWNSAVTLQSAFRCYKAKQLVKRHRSATRLQAAIRGWLTRKKMREEARLTWLKHYAIVVRNHLCAVTVQRAFRNYLARRRALENLQTIIYIQRFWRARHQRLKFLAFRQRVVLLQTVVRRWLRRRHQAASTIQTVARQWLCKRKLMRMEKSAEIIQALWRGYRVRKTIRNKRIKAAQKKIKQANENATEERKLSNRTTTALDFLLKYKHLSSILEALIHLDAATMWSPVCCLRIANENAVEVIYTLIRRCNRSMPHMEIIRYSVSILLNLAKYEETLCSVKGVPGSIETLVDLLLIYREKGLDIFSRVCMLLTMMCHGSDEQQFIKADPKLTKQLISVYNLTARKHRLNEQRQAARKRMLKSQNFSYQELNESTVPQQRVYAHPQWVLGHHRVEELSDPYDAISLLMHVTKLLNPQGTILKKHSCI